MPPIEKTVETTTIPVAITSATSGIATWLDLLGDVLGIVAVTLSIILSVLFIKIHLIKLKTLEKDDD